MTVAKKKTSPSEEIEPDDNVRETDPDWQKTFMATFRLRQARLPERFAGKTLDTYKVERNTRRRDLLQAARSYVAAFNCRDGHPPGLMLQGPVGCGKTHVAVAILKSIIEKGYSGLFYNMTDLLSDIRATFSESTPLTENELLDEINGADLLVLDDLGAERASDWVNDRLYLIVNRRYDSGRPILVTTNLDLGELRQKLGDRIVSRFCEMCETFPEFPDEDYRRKHMH